MDSYVLKIRNGNRRGESIPITASTSVLGRSPESTVPFPDDLKVSSRHCEIIIHEQSCSIQDLASRNGTYLNNQRISKPETLSPGDQIGIGSILLEFTVEADAAGATLPPVSPIAFSTVEENPPPESLASNEEPERRPELGAVDAVQCRLRPIADDGHGSLCWISLDQSMEIGRNDWNDYCFPDDIKMSGKHFRVTLQRDGCVVEDLQSKHGTWVNGVRVERCALVDGAKIQAGSTVFLVQIVGIEWSAPPANVSSAPQLGASSQQSTGTTKAVATRSVLHSDLVRVQGKWDDEPAPVAWLERLLAQKGNAFLLIDRGRVAIEDVDSDPDDLLSLFDWLPYPACNATPHLFNLRTWPSWPSAVEEAWGSDAMMVLATQSTMDELFSHLRRLLRGGTHDDSDPEAIQGICWPSVLRSLLTVEAAGVANDYFSLVDAVWMEGADDPLTWEWIGKSTSLDPLCKSMSIRLRDPQEAKTESSPSPKGAS